MLLTVYVFVDSTTTNATIVDEVDNRIAGVLNHIGGQENNQQVRAQNTGATSKPGNFDFYVMCYDVYYFEPKVKVATKPKG